MVQEATPQDTPGPAWELYASVGMALSAWSRLEGRVSRLYAQSLQPWDFDPASSASVAERGFWFVESFDLKLKMIDATLKASIWMNKPMLLEWAKVRNRLRTANESRNKVAHGTVVVEQVGALSDESPPKTFFSPFYWKQDAQAGVMFRPADYAPERLAGEEIRAFAQSFFALAAEMHALSLAIQKAQRGILPYAVAVAAPQPAASRET